MGFAGDNDLHRTIVVGDDLLQAGGIEEEQVAPLIGGETAGKADGQRLRIEILIGLLDLGQGRSTTLELLL